MTNATKKLRGFAHMRANNPERLTELARKGGASVNPDNRSFSTNRSLAVEAGRKGGSASRSTITA